LYSKLFENAHFKSFKNAIKSVRCRLRRQFYARRVKPRKLSLHSAVVIAPHPDDEILGPGGMLALKRESGVQVHIIFLTAGGNSHSTCCSVSQDEVERIRRKQALESISCLGIQPNDLIWFNLKDGKIPLDGQDGFKKAVINLAVEFDRLKPKEIYCPHPHDCFPDHEAASRIVHNAARYYSHPFRIIYYTVWAWFNAPSPMSKLFDWNSGWLLDISTVFDKKYAAACCYLNNALAPCGYPYCGRLPEALIHGFKKPNEIFFDGNAHNG
jgi:LmbE family N-acetylglucosaminyl deacetylase